MFCTSRWSSSRQNLHWTTMRSSDLRKKSRCLGSRLTWSTLQIPMPNETATCNTILSRAKSRIWLRSSEGSSAQKPKKSSHSKLPSSDSNQNLNKLLNNNWVKLKIIKIKVSNRHRSFWAENQKYLWANQRSRCKTRRGALLHWDYKNLMQKLIN